MASLVCPRGACLRAVNSVVRPSVRVAAPRANFTTSTAAPSRPIQPLRAWIICRMPPQAVETPQKASSIRFNSTTASPTPGSKPDPSAQTEVLTWDKFFDLRRKRRYINLVASIGTAAVAVSTLAPLAAQQDFDSWGAQISGLDPMIVLGITTFTIGAGGWLCGPTFGSAAFRLWAARKGWGKAIMEKEKGFYRRIKAHRADPSASSPQNPVVDYYGEKISSVKDYRRWLKDQRAFKLKKNKNLF